MQRRNISTSQTHDPSAFEENGIINPLTILTRISHRFAVQHLSVYHATDIFGVPA